MTRSSRHGPAHTISLRLCSDVVKTQAPKTKTWTFKTKTETKTHHKELVKDNLLYQDTNQSTILTAIFAFISVKSKVLCCPKKFAKTSVITKRSQITALVML